MPTPDESKRSLKRRLKIVAVSLLGFLIPSACAPPPMCYVPPAPTDTPTPFVMCYVAPAPTETPTTFTSPLSPLPTPTPSPEARRLLREKLLTEGRFPDTVARDLES
ncbi:MAG: hypothetical protein KKC18_01510 [Chloroflexi bacterium]|nr:hypothetical protein [Chloroflexota bacterium]